MSVTLFVLACHRFYSTTNIAQTILLACFQKEAGFKNVYCAQRQILCDLADRCKQWQVVIKLFFYILYQQGSSRFLGRKVQEIKNYFKNIFIKFANCNTLKLRIIFLCFYSPSSLGVGKDSLGQPFM